MFHQIIFYGSYLIFPITAISLWFLGKSKKNVTRIFSILFLLSCVLFFYARFVETQIVTVQNHQIETGFDSKFALISDTHLGVYKKEVFLQKVVNKINKTEVDFVLVAGDLLYEPESGTIPDLVRPLSKINKPVYVVLGNHDVERPGPPVRDELKAALESQGTIFLNNQIVDFRDFKLVALGSRWNEEDDTTLLDQYSPSENILVLAHNPDTLVKYSNPDLADLSVFGHTHGGQIKIPFLYQYVIPTNLKVDEGLYNNEYGQFFITSGVGEAGLPMRLFNPPVIDIIETY